MVEQRPRPPEPVRPNGPDAPTTASPSRGPSDADRPRPTVFISYSWDDEHHKRRVLGLAKSLERDGFDPIIDQQIDEGGRRNVPRWQEQIRTANFVVVVCTKGYRDLIDGQVEPAKGHGVRWELEFIRGELYENASVNYRFIPVVFAADDRSAIPEMLGKYVHYMLHEPGGYDGLIDELRQRAEAPAGAIAAKRLPNVADEFLLARRDAPESTVGGGTKQRAGATTAPPRAAATTGPGGTTPPDAAAWRPAVGQPILDNPTWILDRRLGAGGFGEVWVARHHRSEEQRVFKFCFDARRVAALEREVKLSAGPLRQLRRRRDIAPILGEHLHTPPYWVETQLAELGTFEEWASQGGRLQSMALPERLAIVAQIADALDAAHSAGVIHKDVKPANVLMMTDVDGSAYPRLADFGIGELADPEVVKRLSLSLTAGPRDVTSNPFHREGTLIYMAPELLRGGQASTRSDIYALGVILYQTIVGDLSRPLTAEWTEDLTDDLLRDDVAHATRANPQQRMAGAAELAARLRRLDGRRAERATLRAEAERSAVELAKAREDAERQRIRAEEEAKARTIAEEALREAEEARALAEARSYAADLATADLAIAANDVGEAKRRLACCPKRQRGWEWKHVATRTDQSIAVVGTAFRGGPQGASRPPLAFSPDGRWLFVPRLRIVDLAGIVDPQGDGRAVEHDLINNDDAAREADARDIESDGRWYGGEVSSVAWHPGGRVLATGHLTGGARLWDVRTRRCIARLDAGLLISSIGFDRSGRTLMTCSLDTGLGRWRVAESLDREPMLESRMAVPDVRSAAISPDGEWVMAAQWDSRAALWRADGRSFAVDLGGAPTTEPAWRTCSRVVAVGTAEGLLMCFPYTPGNTRDRVFYGRATQGAVTDVRFGPGRPFRANADLMAIAIGFERGEAHTAREAGHEAFVKAIVERRSALSYAILLHGHTAAVTSVCLLHDGDLAATCSADRTVRIWSTNDGACRRVLRGCDTALKRIEAHPTAPLLATASPSGRVHLWDVSTVEASSRSPAGLDATDALIPDDGSVVLVVSEPTVAALGGPVQQSVAVVRSEDGATLCGLRMPRGGLRVADLSVDGAEVHLGFTSGEILSWRPGTHEPTTVGVHGAPISALASDPRAAILASGGDDGRIVVWSLAPRPVQVDHVVTDGTPVTHLRLTPESRIIVAHTEGGLMRMARLGEAGVVADEVAEFQGLGPLFRGDSLRVVDRGAAVLAVTRLGKGEGRLYRVQRDPPVATHLFSIIAADHAVVDFDRDGRRFLVHDGMTAVVWDVDKRSPTTHAGHDGWLARAAAITPDGSRLAVVKGRSRILFIDAAAGYDGLELATMHGPERVATQLRFSGDGTRLFAVLGGEGGAVCIWDALPWRRRRLRRRNDAASRIAALCGPVETTGPR